MKNENTTSNTTTNSTSSTGRAKAGNATGTRTEKRREALKAYRNAAALIIIIVCSVFSGYVEGHAAPATKSHAEAANKAGKDSNKAKARKASQKARKSTSTKATRKPRKADRDIVQEFIRTTYGDDYKARIQAAEKTPDSIITSRAGKHTVFVDMFVTKADSSSRGHVITAGPCKGNIIKYAHQARRGDVVKVYWIYNPYTNAEDDITAIISGGKIRK